MSIEKLRLKNKNLKREIAALHQKHKLQSQRLKNKEKENRELQEKLSRLEGIKGNERR